MKHTANFDDVGSVMSGLEADIESAVTAAMREGTELLKSDWRDQIEASGLGRRLGRTIRGVTFPQNGASIDAASWVETRAPKLIDAYARGVTIVPKSGKRFLAIPTQDVPRTRQGKPLTPREVEQRFGRPLQFIDPTDRGFWTPSIRRPGVAFLVLKNLVVRKATGRWRNASERELRKGRAGERALSHVVMFILVPQVRVKQRLNLDALMRRAADRLPDLLAKHWSRIPDR